MRTVLLVPRRKDDGPRDRIWDYCRRRWERYFPDIPIYEGHHDEGPFNRSKAVNRAAALADEAGSWDYAIVIDSDVLLKESSVRAAVATAQETGRVTWAHRRWRGLSEYWTGRTLADKRDFGAEVDRDDMDVLVERTTPISWSCCQVIPRPVFDGMGGFDERFEGWGFEDLAFQSVVVGMFGHERIEGDVYHLFHPRSEERIEKGKPATTATREYAINARLGRRYMVALRRDHGLHDRPGLPASDAERTRDIGNLIRDDARMAEQSRHHDLPDWDDWWPTLEELVEGAKVHRLGPLPPEPTVTVVVHTGGAPETWPERSEYLRRSLASLSEQVSGLIVQRVVYTDWPDALRDELAAIAGAHGFYVAGEGHHGYTRSMRRMWSYLAKRAVGEFIFATEDDFLYDRPVDLEPMIATLRDKPSVVQLALLRAPYYTREIEAGSVLASLKTATTTVSDNGHTRVEHRDHWTANPSLFRRSLTQTPWPDGKSSERLFGHLVLKDPRSRFAYWGDGTPWISHIGAVRAGSGY